MVLDYHLDRSMELAEHNINLTEFQFSIIHK